MPESAQGIRGIRTLPESSSIFTSTEEAWVIANALLGTPVENETPSGTIDGANKTFTLANTPVSGSVKLYLNGMRLKLNSDFTLSTATITLLGDAPETGMNILVDYRK